MNSVVLSGRLTKKPELRSTSNGKYVCNFSLAVDRGRVDEEGKREVDFIDCTCFGKTAENLVKYQDKGSMIEVNGRLQRNVYTDNEGKNRANTFVCVEMINYISTGKTAVNEVKNDEKRVYKEFGNRINSRNDLPF